jgi:hypothetical protein
LLDHFCVEPLIEMAARFSSGNEILPLTAVALNAMMLSSFHRGYLPLWHL